MQGFDIYFLGEILPDTDPTAVREGVARLFKIDPAAADRLFSGKALRVKQGVDVDSASRYRAAFRDAGALVQIVPEGSAPPARRPAPAATTATAPAAPGTEPTAVMTLAEPGAVIDHTPAPAPVEIDTSDLEVLPPNTGSLADCQVEKPPRPIPDISHIKIVED
jgi:hypothetical protein